MSKREGNLIVNKFDIKDDFAEKLGSYSLKLNEEELKVVATEGE